MAYSESNPPACYVQGVGANPAWWSYNSSDAATAVRVDGYITNAQDLGMKVGDLMFQSGATAAHIYRVMAIQADGSADLSDGTAIVVTNTD